MTTKWAHLPNAVHINRIIASMNTSPSCWVTVDNSKERSVCLTAKREVWEMVEQYTPRAAGLNAAWEAVRQIVRGSAAQDAQHAVDNARRAGYFAVYSRILVLAAYDDCAYMLDSAPDDISMFAMLGDQKAILLLSTCKAFHSTKSVA